MKRAVAIESSFGPTDFCQALLCQIKLEGGSGLLDFHSSRLELCLATLASKIWRRLDRARWLNNYQQEAILSLALSFVGGHGSRKGEGQASRSCHPTSNTF